LPRALRRAELSEARLNARGGDLCFGVGASFAGRFGYRARRLAGPALRLFAGREPKTLAIHLQNVDMVRETVEERAGEPFRSEDRGPFIEWQVAGHQCRAAFVALAEDLEEKLRANRRERHVAEFVDDQQLDRVEMLLQRAKAALVARLHEFVNESGRRREGDVVALLASRETQSQGDVGLAGAGGTQRDAVLPLLDPFAARQFENQWLVDRGLGGEVERVEAFDLCEAGLTNAALVCRNPRVLAVALTTDSSAGRSEKAASQPVMCRPPRELSPVQADGREGQSFRSCGG
jgi:hypothetical protein